MVQQTIIEASIPAELKEYPQWVVWKKEERGNGKFAKVPMDPNSGNFAKINDPSTWGAYIEAVQAYTNGTYDGIGFVFTEDDPFVGIDADHCFDATGNLSQPVDEIVQQVASYTELSPSGHGIHIIAKGSVTGPNKRLGLIEMYDRNRFFTVTGEHYKSSPREITAPEGIDALCRTENPAANPDSRRAEEDAKYTTLFRGDYSGYPSQSEADLALCQMIAYRHQNNREVINDVFRLSGLYRDKWERADYRESTIDKAIQLNSARAQSGSSEIINLTDLGNSKRLINRYGESIRYCTTSKRWLVWNGAYWEEDHKAQVQHMARQIVKSLYHEASEAYGEERQKVAQHALKTESMSRLNAMVALAKDDSRVRVREEELDPDPWLLNCMNGVIDLRIGQLLPHDPRYMITKIVPATYHPDAMCPTWDDFLLTIMGGNDEMIRFLQRAIGYSLTGDTREQCFFILYGSGANGKSTFLNPVIRLLNDYARQTPPDTFLSLKRRGINNDLARLKGVRFVTATEPEANQSFAEGVLKQITGGDTITARYLHQEYFDFIPAFKLFLATNHKPHVKGTDTGIWRRIRLIPFEVTIPKEQRDHQLGQRLLEELPGILAWAVRGCSAWQESGLGVPQQVMAATDDYAREMDTVARYIDECCDMQRGLRCTNNDLYAAYQNWCEQEGEEVLPKTTFFKQIRGKGFVATRNSLNRGWNGIGLKQMPMPPKNNAISARVDKDYGLIQHLTDGVQ